MRTMRYLPWPSGRIEANYPSRDFHLEFGSAMTLTEEEAAIIRGRLHELEVEHRDLDLVIDHLSDSPPPDQLLVRRLKKRKLQLKDRIKLLENMLVPDIPA